MWVSFPTLFHVAILAALVILTLLAVRSARTIAVIRIVGLGLLNALRVLAASVASIMDFLVAIDTRNGRPAILGLTVVIAINMTVVGAWLVTHSVANQIVWTRVAGAFIAAMLLWNVLFVLGSYWALRENVQIMNGDKSYNQRQFKDLSTAKSLEVVVVVVILIVFQISSLLLWLQSSYGLEIVDIKSSILGLEYADFVVASLEALPFTSLYMIGSGLSQDVVFASGLAGATARAAIATIGSALIVSTILGFFLQRASSREFIERLLDAQDPRIVALLEERLTRAPAVLKSHLRAAFLSETDDARLQKLVRYAIAKHSFGFPETFIRTYGRLSDGVREMGAKAVADFVQGKGQKFEIEPLTNVLEAITKAFPHKVFPRKEDRVRAGLVTKSCIETLLRQAADDPAARVAAQDALRKKPIRVVLAALMYNAAYSRRCADILIDAKAADTFPDIVRCQQYMGEGDRVATLTAMANLARGGHVTFSQTATDNTVVDMIRAIDWNVHNVRLGQRDGTALADFRKVLAALERSAQSKRRASGVA
jgi:hypothetical protein